MIFTAKDLSKFLDEFNPLYQKYFGENFLPGKYKSKSKRKAVEEYISRQQAEYSEKKKLSAAEMLDVYNIVDKVYVNTGADEDYVYIYQMIQDKLIDEFVNIDGIKELYQPLFFVFEWMMHLEYQPEKDSYSFYRDHFIHQVRNMYEMLKLLTDKEAEMYKDCIESFEKGNSLLDIEMRKVVKRALETNQGIEDFKQIGEILEMEEPCCKENIYKYILMASAVLTSVVHDIGYPIEYFCNNLERMEKFLPVSGYFFEKKSYVTQLHALLEESLLYRVVAPDKISKRLKDGNHGAISACILLTKYYKNGKIHSLSSIQKMIIELSALTIYEHTLCYEIHGKDDADKYQPVFEENPFSFLFRLSDDIEEWNRTYFDITKQSNFLVCGNCHTIINPWNIVKDDTSKSSSKRYACCCGEKGENQNLFKYRKMAHINTCHEVKWKKIKKVAALQKTIGYKIKLDYDLVALLQAAAYGEQFAVKRIEALIEIKKMVFDQKGIYSIYVESFISNNPIAIKTEIVSLYMKKWKRSEWEKIWRKCKKASDIYEAFEVLWKEVCDVLAGEIVDMYLPAGDIKIRELLIENVMFYIRMATLQEYLKRSSNKMDEMNLLNLAGVISAKENIFLKSITILISDSLIQASRIVSEVEFWEDKWNVKDRYFEMYTQSKDSVLAVESYIKSPLYDYVRARTCISSDAENRLRTLGIKKSECRYDFYSDYWLIQKMYDSIRKRRY